MRLHRLLVVVLSLLAVQQARAAVSLISGPGTPVANPNNQRYYADPYNVDAVFYWTERTSYTLPADLVVSILPPGSFPADSTSHSNDNSLTVPSGSTIDSYLLNYDPQSGSVVARFHFDDPIAGLITNSRDTAANDHFMLSDYLINPLVPPANIPTAHYDARGIEPDAGDYVHWFGPNDIELHIGASSPGDQVRVITMAQAPEPATVAVLALGLPAILFRRRPLACGAHAARA